MGHPAGLSTEHACASRILVLLVRRGMLDTTQRQEHMGHGAVVGCPVCAEGSQKEGFRGHQDP